MGRLALFFILIAYAFAHQMNDCESRLMFPLSRLVRMANAQNQLSVEEIEALAQAPAPYNPLNKATRTTRNSSLKRVLDENVRALAPSKWPDVQHELRDLAANLRQMQGQAVDAKNETLDLFLPDVIHEFRKGSQSNDNAFVYTDEHGHIISIFIAGKLSTSGAAYLEVTDLTAKTPTERTYIGELFAPEFSAYVTPEHRVRVAFQAKAEELRIIALPDTDNSQVIHFKHRQPGGPAPTKPENADSSPSNFLFTRAGRRLIAATNHNTIQVFDLDRPEEPLFEYTCAYEFPALRLFETRGGKILLSFKNNKVLTVAEIDGENSKLLLSRTMRSIISSASFWEGRDGTVYLSACSGGTYYLFTPLTSQEPFFHEALLPQGRDENFWFRDSDGRDLNYVMSSQQLPNTGVTLCQVAVFDAFTKQKIFIRESNMFYAGSPFLKGPGGAPRLVFVGGPKHSSEVSVIDPLHDTPTHQLKLSQPIDATGFQSMTRFIDPKGNEALLVNGKFKGSVLRLFNSPIAH